MKSQTSADVSEAGDRSVDLVPVRGCSITLLLAASEVLSESDGLLTQAEET